MQYTDDSHDSFLLSMKKLYPKLYSNLNYVEAPAGWFDMIAELSSVLEPLITSEESYVVQIKEKFGGLRFYMNSYDKELDYIIGQYEKLSFNTCETCGIFTEKPVRTKGYIRTLCKECSIKETLSKLQYEHPELAEKLNAVIKGE